MVIVYRTENVKSTVTDLKTYLFDAQVHMKEFIDSWTSAHREQDALAVARNKGKYPEFGTVTSSTNMRYASINQTRYTSEDKRGALILATKDYLDKITARAVRLEKEAIALSDSMKLYATNAKRQEKPPPSRNPYGFSMGHTVKIRRSSSDETPSDPKVHTIGLTPSSNIAPGSLRARFKDWEQPTQTNIELDKKLTSEMMSLCRKTGLQCEIEDREALKSTGRKLLFFPFLNFLGILINKHRIDSIGNKVTTLLDNDQLQDDQIHHIANYMNMTMIKVATLSKNQLSMITFTRDMARQLKTLASTSLGVEKFFLIYELLMMEFNQLQHLLGVMQDELAMVREALVTVQTHKLTPKLVPPNKLFEYLEYIEKDLKTKPRLTLPGNFREDVWSFYSIIKVDPILTDNTIILSCVIPLVDESLNLHLYKVHNLPAVHKESKLMVKYNLESEYFAVSADNSFVTIPDSFAINFCEASRQHVCHLSAPLIPKEKCQACLCALFDDLTSDQSTRIQKQCYVSASEIKSSQAVSLGENLWAVVPAREMVLFKHCHDKPERMQVTPPVTFVNLTGGCYAFTDDLYLTSQSHFSHMVDVIDRWIFVKNFETSFKLFDDLRLWTYLTPNTTSLDEILNWKAEKLPYLPAELPLGRLGEHIQSFSMKSFKRFGKLWWFVMVGCPLIALVVAIIGYILYRRGTLGLALKTFRGFKGLKTRKGRDSGRSIEAPPEPRVNFSNGSGDNDATVSISNENSDFSEQEPLTISRTERPPSYRKVGVQNLALESRPAPPPRKSAPPPDIDTLDQLCTAVQNRIKLAPTTAVNPTPSAPPEEFPPISAQDLQQQKLAIDLMPHQELLRYAKWLNKQKHERIRAASKEGMQKL